MPALRACENLHRITRFVIGVKVMNLRALILLLLSYCTVAAVACERADAEPLPPVPHFEVQELPLLPPGEYTDLQIGKFDGSGCPQLLARESPSQRIVLVRPERAPEEASGIPSGFPLGEAFTVNISLDGRTDLIGFDPHEQRWWVAFTHDGGRFASEKRTVEDIPPPHGRSYVSRNTEGDAVVINDPEKRGNYSYREPATHFTFYGDLSGNSPVLLGSLHPTRDFNISTVSGRTLAMFEQFPNRLMFADPTGWQMWAHFPESYAQSSGGIDVRDLLVGDFNGDGRDDVVVPGWYFGQWWIAVGHGNTSTEHPANGLKALQRGSDHLVVGDINCDGRDDIIQQSVHGGRVRAAVAIVDSPTGADGLRGRAISGSPSEPAVCVGYIPREGRGRWGSPLLCPDGYAAYSGALETFRKIDTCCRMPHPDILTEKHYFVADTCPDGSVVTGVNAEGQLRCTGINHQRYELLDETPGLYWGHNRDRFKQRSYVERAETPLAIRHSLGRRAFQDWEDAGCVGFPWGSLFVEYHSTICAEQRYRRLAYRGVGGDPLEGTPVEMMPKCVGGVEVFQPDAGCLAAK